MSYISLGWIYLKCFMFERKKSNVKIQYNGNPVMNMSKSLSERTEPTRRRVAWHEFGPFNEMCIWLHNIYMSYIHSLSIMTCSQLLTWYTSYEKSFWKWDTSLLYFNLNNSNDEFYICFSKCNWLSASLY
jgi:hypothetical protein